MNDQLWAKEQLDLRKLANQFLSKVHSTGCRRILITSVEKGDGKSRFITELAAEMARVNQEIIPLAAVNLRRIPPERFRHRLVVVYGPAYHDENGLHTLSENWMRSFDAAVVLVMLRRTRGRDLARLIGWLKEYQIDHIWPVANEKEAPALSEMWDRFKSRFGGKTAARPAPTHKPGMVSLPLLAPIRSGAELPALPPPMESAVETGGDDQLVSNEENEVQVVSDEIQVTQSRAEAPESAVETGGDDQIVSNEENEVHVVSDEIQGTRSRSAVPEGPSEAPAMVSRIISVAPPQRDSGESEAERAWHRARQKNIFGDFSAPASARSTIRTWSSVPPKPETDETSAKISSPPITILSSSPPPPKIDLGRQAEIVQATLAKVTLITSVPPPAESPKSEPPPPNRVTSIRATLISTVPPAPRPDSVPPPTTPQNKRSNKG